MRTLQYHSKTYHLQIRKLYEPAKYESALIHPVFLEYFHRNVTELSSSLPYICAIGFEPNPNHEQMLKSKISIYENFLKKLKELNCSIFIKNFLQI